MFQTKSMPEFVFVLQNIMVDVVEWLSDLARLNAAFKRIACNVSTISFLEHSLLCHTKYWTTSIINLIWTTISFIVSILLPKVLDS